MKTTPTQRYWQDVEEGDVLPPLVMQTSLKQTIEHVGADRDFMAGHYNPAYARPQGQPDIYFNALFHQSMVDRVTSDWAGPACFVTRKKTAVRGSIHAGDHLRGEGCVTRRYVDEHGRYCLDLEITLSVAKRVCCDASAPWCFPSLQVPPPFAFLAEQAGH